MKYTVKSDKTRNIEIEKKSNYSELFKISVDDDLFEVQIKEFHANGRIKTLMVNNQVIPVEILKHADGFPRTIYLNGLPFDVEIEKIKSLSTTIESIEKEICGDIRSGLPGQILSVLVQIGDQVEQGQILLTLESMKMENEILSPKSGSVSAVLVSVGQVVKKDELIIQIH